MDFEQNRKELSSVIFRGRIRKDTAQLHASEKPEFIHLADVLLPEDCETDLNDEDCLSPAEELLWERVRLKLHDNRDPTQTALTLILARKESLRPPFKTVTLLHGTGKCSTTRNMISIATRFMSKDFMVVLLNSRYHGCRRGDELSGKERYIRELVSAWQRNQCDVESHCYPFIYDTAADLVSVADYLLSRSDVSRSCLGIAGISLGGMHAWFAAAADERWTAVAPLIGVQSFNYAIENNCFHHRVDTIRKVFEEAARDEQHETITCETVRAVWNRICPGLLERFDAEFSLPLLYPRHVFIANGELDPRCPIEGVQEALSRARQTCLASCGHQGNFELHVYPGVEHEVTDEMWKDCVGFFERVFAQKRLSVDRTEGSMLTAQRKKLQEVLTKENET